MTSMLIRCSGDKPFIFIANTKAASTSIHKCDEIVRDCEIRIWTSRFGKHLGVKQIKNRYDFIFDIVPFSKFSVVMIVREPVDWFMSWYRYRQTGALRTHERTSLGLSPEQFFFEKFRNENINQSRLLGGLEPDENLVLMRFGTHFLDDFKVVSEQLGWPEGIQFPHHNKSDSLEDVSSGLSESFQEELRKHYADDFELWQKANENGSWA